jgi:hypothetical protein
MSFVRLSLEPGRRDLTKESFEDRISFVREVWQGQCPLSETYWFWGWLINGLFIGLLGGILVGSVTGITGNSFFWYLYLALEFPISIWLLIGIWRSARNHPSVWATVVKVSYIITVPATILYWARILSLARPPQ